MANNDILYNAVVSGVAGGSLNRWIKDPSSSAYLSQRNVAVSLAGSIDALIAAGSYTQQDGNLLQSLVSGVMTNRQLSSTQSDEYIELARALAAIFTEMSAALQPVGGAAVRSIGWTAAAPLVLTLMPAGHAPGFYSLSLAVVVRTVATAGTITRSYSYSTPVFGLTGIAGFGGAGITTLGSLPLSFTSFSCYSDGVSPITVTLTPAATTGAPVIDVTAQAVKIGT